MDEKALFKLSYGLYIISSTFEGKDAGCIVNTLHQITAEPIRVSISLHKDNYTTQVIQNSKVFSAVALTQSTPMEVIGAFGFQSSKDYEKYQEGTYQRDSLHVPYLTNHTAARLACKVEQVIDIDTHLMFIGKVIEAEILSEEEVMTYSYYHKVKNGATPKNAPSYQAKSEKKGFRCTICGYIYEGDTLPEDYICPLCSAPAFAFEKI